MRSAARGRFPRLRTLRRSTVSASDGVLSVTGPKTAHLRATVHARWPLQATAAAKGAAGRPRHPLGSTTMMANPPPSHLPPPPPLTPAMAVDFFRSGFLLKRTPRTGWVRASVRGPESGAEEDKEGPREQMKRVPHSLLYRAPDPLRAPFSFFLFLKPVLEGSLICAVLLRRIRAGLQKDIKPINILCRKLSIRWANAGLVLSAPRSPRPQSPTTRTAWRSWPWWLAGWRGWRAPDTMSFVLTPLSDCIGRDRDLTCGLLLAHQKNSPVAAAQATRR